MVLVVDSLAQKLLELKFTGILLVGGTTHPKAVQQFSLANSRWRSLADLISERRYHRSVTLENGVYIVGGVGNKNIERYDPSTGTFVTVGSLAEYPYSFGVCAFDHESFIFAGGKEGNDF